MPIDPKNKGQLTTSRRNWLRKAARERASYRKLVAQLKRVKAGYRLSVAMASKRQRQINRLAEGPQKRSLKWARAQIGTTEHPAGSNRGPKVSAWQREIAGGGTWLNGAPWCGVFVGVALKRGGVKGITGRVAAVSFIYDDAKAGRNGFKKLVSTKDAKPGDAVGLFSRSTHVEIVERVDVRRGVLYTIGGNTSSGSGGSQSNGGGVFARTRSFSDVAYIARPDWP